MSRIPSWCSSVSIIRATMGFSLNAWADAYRDDEEEIGHGDRLRHPVHATRGHRHPDRAGAHLWGSVASLPLIPAVVDAVAPVPVVAAGGIGDGRGLAAVLALGAAAGWLGTRFAMAEETPSHPRYRELLLEAPES